MNLHSPLNLDASHLLIALGWIALAAPSTVGQAATQAAPSSAPYVATMTFDVASVRENKNLDANAGITMSLHFVPGTTVLHVLNLNIENLISYAFGVEGYQIAGLPHWPFPTLFVIEAKSDGEADAKMAELTGGEQQAEQQHMLQALLAERFRLKTHWETKEGDVYRLVLAKGGPKLGAAGSTPPSAEELNFLGDRPVPAIYQRNDRQGYDFVAHNCSMEELVKTLTGTFDRPVSDATGLTGNHDFVLRYKGRWDRDRPADDLDPMPPMDRALQEELGLKIEPARGPLQVLVIDHVERPSEN